MKYLLIFGASLLPVACADRAYVFAPARGPGARSAFGPARPAELLAAATDPTAEIQGPLTSPREPEGPLEVGRDRPRRDLKFGARGGFLSALVPGWETGWRAGAYYRGRLPNRMPLELGVDLGALKREDGTISSDLAYLRADVLLRKRGPHHRRVVLDPVVGLEVAREHAEFPGSGRETDRYVPGLRFGLGLGAPSGRWDVRLRYSLLIGSDDVAGEGFLAVAVGF